MTRIQIQLLIQVLMCQQNIEYKLALSTFTFYLINEMVPTGICFSTLLYLYEGSTNLIS